MIPALGAISAAIVIYAGLTLLDLAPYPIAGAIALATGLLVAVGLHHLKENPC